MLYDEPTTGLDPIMSDVINELILQTQQNEQKTGIVVTHDMKTVLKVADRVVMLYPLARLGPDESQILYDGPPEGLEDHPDPRVRQFVRGEAGERLREMSQRSRLSPRVCHMHDGFIDPDNRSIPNFVAHRIAPRQGSSLMNERVMQFRIGMFVIVAGLVLTMLIVWFGEIPRSSASTATSMVHYDEAPGVSEGIPVRKSGIRIGEVVSIDFDDRPGQPDGVLVTLSLETQVQDPRRLACPGSPGR